MCLSHPECGDDRAKLEHPGPAQQSMKSSGMAAMSGLPAAHAVSCITDSPQLTHMSYILSNCFDPLLGMVRRQPVLPNTTGQPLSARPNVVVPCWQRPTHTSLTHVFTTSNKTTRQGSCNVPRPKQRPQLCLLLLRRRLWPNVRVVVNTAGVGGATSGVSCL